MKFKLTGLPTTITFGFDKVANEQILQRLSYYTLCKIADETQMSSISGMAIELCGKMLNLDECGNFKSITVNISILPTAQEKACPQCGASVNESGECTCCHWAHGI